MTKKYWTYYFREKDRYHQLIEATFTDCYVDHKRISENRVFSNKQEAQAALYQKHGVQSK